jgi:hypothetical protein
MRLKVVREPYENDGGVSAFFKRKEYDGVLHGDNFQVGFGGWLTIAFSTNPNGERRSVFSAVIHPRDFEALAMEMVKANPQAAVKAFGAAMQTVACQDPREADATPTRGAVTA